MAIFTKMKKAGQAHDLAKKVQDDSQRTLAEIELLREKIDLLVMVNQSLWTIMAEHLELDDATLEKKVRELEEQFHDDVPPVACASCGKPLHVKKKRCVFCGTEQTDKNLFDSLRG